MNKKLADLLKTRKRKIIVLLVIVFILLVFGFLMLTPDDQTSTSSDQIAVSDFLRSKTPDIITQVTFAKGIDPLGNPNIPMSKFTQNDKMIYVFLAISKPPKDTRIEYIRYFNGQRLDNKSATLTDDRARLVFFKWENKKSTPGIYTVKFYVNGVFDKEAFYTILGSSG